MPIIYMLLTHNIHIVWLSFSIYCTRVLANAVIVPKNETEPLSKDIERVVKEGKNLYVI